MDTSAPTLRLIKGEKEEKVEPENKKKTWLFHVPIEIRGAVDRYIEADTEDEALEEFQKLNIWEWVQMWGVNSVLTWDDEADGYARRNVIVSEASTTGGQLYHV